MRVLPLAWSYLKGRPTRTIMTILSIVIGVMIMFGLNGMAPALKDIFVTNTESTALSNVDLYVSRRDGSFFRQELEQDVAAVDGVASTAGMIIRSVLVPEDHYQTPDGNDISTILVFGIDTSVTDDAFNIIVASGRQLDEGRVLQPGDGPVVIISRQFADGAGVDLGDQIELPGASGWMKFEVVGIVDEPGVLLGNQNVFMPIEYAQNLLNTPNRINTIMARYDDGVDARAIDAEVQALFGHGYELAPLEGGQDVWAALLEFVNVIFTMFGLLALAMAGLIMYNTFRTSVVERQRDIGLLRAVGAKRGVVMRVVLIEGMIQAVIGTLVGMILGFGFAYLSRNALSNTFEDLLGSPLGEPRFEAFTFIVSILFGLGIPLISVFMPARGASQVTPLEAMRPSTVESEKAVRRGRAIIGLILLAAGLAGLFSGEFGIMALGMLIFLLALGLLGPLLIGPITSFFNRALALVFGLEGRLATGNIARQPRRASVTASSLMVSLAIIIGLGGMLASTYGGAAGFMDSSLKSDYVMMAGLIVTNDTLGAGPDLAETVERIPGVKELTTLRQTDISTEDGIGVRLLGIDPADYARIGGLTFVDGDESAFAEMEGGQKVIINGRYASQFGASVGDTVTLDGGHGPVEFEVAAIGLDYLNIKLPTIYIDQVSLTREYGVRNDMFLLINAEPDADIEQLEEDLLAASRLYPGFGVISREQLQRSVDNTSRAGTIGMNIILGLLAAPSLLGLANAMGINVIERTREIGMLRAVGARRRQVRRMIAVESILLAMMGIALGIISGIFLSMVMTGVLEFYGLIIPYSLPIVGILTAIAVGLIAGVVAAMIPARRASDLQIVAALAYE